MDYGRPLLQPGANSNSPPRWTAARVTGLGEFRALSRLTTTPCRSTARAAALMRPVRPAAAELAPGADTGGDDGLGGLLQAIADEVQGRASTVCDGISADFAARIMQTRKTLPRDQVAATVAALKQAKKAAVQFVRESAAIEVRGLQKQARVMFRRGRIRAVIGKIKLDY